VENHRTKDKLAVAFIGAGYMTREHGKAFADIDNIRLAGISSRTRQKAEELAIELGIGEVCDSISELYRKTQAQLAVVAVSVLSTREVCLEAFKYPWTLLIEKPAGYDVEEAKIIVKAAVHYERQAFVALNRRHYSSTHCIVDDLSEFQGQRLIHVYDQEDPCAPGEPRRPELLVQNWMYANSIHVIDYFRIFGRGEIVSVDPVIRWIPDEPRFVAAKLTYSSGDIGFYEAIWNGPGPWGVTVTTPQRRWELRPLEQAAFQPYGSRELVHLKVHERDIKFKPGLRLQAKEAVKAVQKKAHKLPNLEDALMSMQLVQQIYA